MHFCLKFKHAEAEMLGMKPALLWSRAHLSVLLLLVLFMRFVTSQFLVCIFLFLPACGGTDPIVDPGDPDEGGDKSACESSETKSVLSGEGVGSSFVPFEDGDGLVLEFASQAGMAASVSVWSSGIGGDEVTEIVCRLVVEGEPLGESTTSGDGMRCDDGELRLDTSLPIDVYNHPTIASVPQLIDKSGQLEIEVFGKTGLIAQSSVNVILVL